MSDHPSVEELADAAAGLLDDPRTHQVEQHLVSCDDCREVWDALASVSDLLGSQPAPVMPPEVARRLDEALAAERQPAARSTDRDRQHSTDDRPVSLGGVGTTSAHSLGVFGADVAGPRRSRWVAGGLLACVAASVIGFGGYVLSASAGLNEPSTAPAVVSTSRLAAQAHSLLQGTDLTPHRFSQAWQCAREVTDGRITAITNAVVDGRPALLVYTRSDDVEHVTVVNGCGDGHPAAGPSTALPR